MCTFCWEAPQGHPRCGEGPGPASREGLTLGQDGLTGVGSAALDRVLDLHRSHLGTWGTFLAVSVQGELRAGGAWGGSWSTGWELHSEAGPWLCQLGPERLQGGQGTRPAVGMGPDLDTSPCSGRLGFVCDVFCKDVLLKMSNSLRFAQALTPGSGKTVGSIKHQCSSSAECLGVRVQYLDGFARPNTLCRSGLSKSPRSQDLHKFLCLFWRKGDSFPSRMHLLAGAPSPGTFLTVNFSEGLIFFSAFRAGICLSRCPRSGAHLLSYSSEFWILF